MSVLADHIPQPPQGVRLAVSELEGAGRGMFATRNFACGELIESCPVISLPDVHDRARLRRTGLVNYYFLWGPERTHAAICLGYGSLYNHAYEPNARWEKCIDAERMDFYAIRDIADGEEITVNYNGVPADTRKLWIRAIPPANATMDERPRFSQEHPVRYRMVVTAFCTSLAVGLLAAAYIHLA